LSGAAVAIQRLTAADWDAVRGIYLEGIATGDATFEADAPGWEIWDGAHRQDARLVARRGGRVIGWAALTRVSGRCVYAGVAEVSVYVAESARGEGVGRALLEALIAASEQAGVWTLQAGIFPENAASIALHERCGFRVVGRRERLGRLGPTWRDVMLLERRSPRVGMD
jgi:L-amino acid N-acyltransferase YncA